MTLEHPMFPPRAEQCNIINFAHAFAAKVDRKLEAPQGRADQKLLEAYDRAATSLRCKTRKLSPTGANLRLRLARREAWWKAGRLVDYWQARLNWQTALQTAQRWGVGDAKEFEAATPEERVTLLALGGRRWPTKC